MTRSGEVTMIFATTVLTGVVLIGLLFFGAPVLGPVLVVIARLPSPLGEIVWLAVLLPLGVMGPPMLWVGIAWIVARVCGLR
jgi:hypothetical protein